MSIDYDRLRELLDEAPTGPWLCEKDGDEYEFVIGTEDFGIITEVNNEADGQLIALAPDMARELLRLHGGIEVVRDYCAGNARSARAAGMHTLANEMYATVKALAELLEGDTE